MTENAGTNSQARIVDLREEPSLTDQVIRINSELWGELTDLNFDEMADLFTAEPDETGLPLTLIAVINDELAGLVSLRDETLGMVKHPEAYLPGESPWLSNMWVAEWARGRKLASRLTEELENRARELGYTQIYSSAGQADSLYHKLGYEEIGRKPLRELTIHLIRKDLSASA